jgi:hypothetical protein
LLTRKQGTTTAFSISQYEVTDNNWEYLESLPETERWRAHRTCPITEFFADWTLRYEKLVWFMSPRDYLAAGTLHCRADNRQEEEELCHKDLTQWISDLSEAEKIEDDVDRQIKILRLKYPAVSVGDIYDVVPQNPVRKLIRVIQDVYNTYLRYGWGSGSFDKQACKVTLAKMEQDHDEEVERLEELNESNDDDLFD